MLDVLEYFIQDLKYSYVRMDGKTTVPERQKLIDQYNNNDEIFIFLLSTIAGGLGINLTTADTVIFYDISFNPQVDRQAEDRCHRLGQKKPVTIYKMLVQGSCEQQMLEMAQEKTTLNDLMLEEGKYDAWDKQMQDELVYEIFKVNTRRRKKPKGKKSKAKKRKREDYEDDGKVTKKRRVIKTRSKRRSKKSVPKEEKNDTEE